MNDLNKIIAKEKERLKELGYTEEQCSFLNDAIFVKGIDNSILVLKNGQEVYLR